MSAEPVMAIAAVVAAIVSILALIVAARSAAAAETSAMAATSALRRTAVRELVILCHEVLGESLRTDELGATLKSEYKSLFALSGSSGGSRETTLQSVLADDLAAASGISAEATSLGDDLDKLRSASDEDIDHMSTRLIKARTRLGAIRESIELQLSEAWASRQQLLRERA